MKKAEAIELIGNSVSSLNSIIDSTPSCLKIITNQGRLLHMNAQGLDLIEAEDLDSVTGANVYDLVEPSHRMKFKKFNETVCSGETGYLNFEIIGLKGSRRSMETYAAPYKLTNGETAHIAITNDISTKIETERKILEQNQLLANSSRLASLGQFVGGVAHEINNPLAVILGKLSLLEMELANGKFDQAVFSDEIHKVIETTERISEIINNLKTFSRDPKHDERESTKIDEIVKDTLSLCSEKLRLKNIGIETDISPNTEISCQKVQISQVLMNLINNSVDAINLEENSWIKITSRRNPQHVSIEFTDSGSGIPAHIANKMLDPFFTTKEVGKGTGLGLSISSGILNSHGGKLLYNPHHDNTQFILEFPNV